MRPEVAYNLAFPAIVALGVSIAFVLGRALFGRCRWGALTALCIFFAGNIASAFNILEKPMGYTGLYEYHATYLWNTTRIIVDGPNQEAINEYPLFTILWGDLHPHFSNIPFALLFLMLAYMVYQALENPPRRKFYKYYGALLLITAVSCGFLYPTNVFDFPICALVYAGLIFFQIVRYVFWKGRSLTWSGVLAWAGVIFLPAVGFLLAAPFWLHFESPIKGDLIQFCQYQTSLTEFFLVCGAHITAMIAYLIFRIRSISRDISKEEIGFVAVIFGILFIILWARAGYIVYALLPILAAALWLLVLVFSLGTKESTRVSSQERFALILCALAWSAMAGCEFIYLRDGYGSRMNTIFKVYFASWILLGIGLPYLVYTAARMEKQPFVKWFTLIPVMGLFILSFTTPLYAFKMLFTIPKTLDRPITLDGLAFLKTSHPHLHRIIEWVRENTEPTDRIVEVPGCPYRNLESLVSAATGRQSLIGWTGHEGLWRGHPPEVRQREEDVFRFYESQNLERSESDARSIQGPLRRFHATNVRKHPQTDAKNETRDLPPKITKNHHRKQSPHSLRTLRRPGESRIVFNGLTRGWQGQGFSSALVLFQTTFELLNWRLIKIQSCRMGHALPTHR